MDSPTRAALEAEYLHLIREVLPARAAVEGWVVRLDHCFGRILLDHVFQRPWRERFTGRAPAYRQLSNEQLSFAIGLARRIESEGDRLLRQLNRNSLEWRGKISSQTL